MSRSSRFVVSVTVILVVGLAAGAAFAQNAASLRGVVRDTAGSPMPGVTVSASNSLTGETVGTVVAGADGIYVLSVLEPGRYRVQAALAGFQTEVTVVEVPAGAEVTVDFTLVPRRFAGEVTVTALKRGEQRLVDIPLAVTAVGGEELEETGAQSLLDVIQTAPGATAYETGPGVNTVQIRGISATTGDSPVGYYLDETPFALVGTYYLPDVSMFDLERVEILRGPMGTLYGDGALGGVLRFLTQNPDLQELEARGDLSYGTYSGGEDTYTANAAVSVPIVKDRFAIRATGSYRHLGGWVDSPFFGDNINDQTFETYRFKGLVQATDRLRITASAWYNRHEADGTNDANDDDVIESPIEQPSDGFYDIYSAVVEYEADAFSLLSASSYIDQEWNLTAAIALAPGVAAGADATNRLESFVQEIRLTSKSTSAFAWTAGAFYRDSDTPIILDLPAFGLYSEYTNSSESVAVFGEGVYTFAEKLDLTLGLRYFEDSRVTDDPVNQISGEADFDTVTPRVNLAYRPAPGQLFYLNVAKGFRSGQVQSPFTTLFAQMIGVEVPAAIDPENAWTYEIGLKREFGNRVMLEGAAYYTDYTDLQFFVPVAGNPILAYYNVGSATIPGVDWVVTARPTDEWSLSFGGNWNQAEYAEDAVVEGVTLVRKGDRLQNVPELSLNGSLRYARTFGSRGWLGFGDLRAQYSSERFSPTGDAAASEASSDTILTVQVRAGVLTPFGEVALFVNNATNERGAIAPPFASNRYGQSRLAPRQIGLNLKLSL
jgi:outer membrane receptor protein involved in Fe transport